MSGSSVRSAQRQVSVALLLVLIGFVLLGPLGTTTSWAFGDVPGTFWAAAWIAWLVEMGLVKGYPGDLYKPDEPVTRAQMAVFIGRVLQEARSARGLGWVMLTGSGEVDINVVADLNAVPDPGQAEPGLAAGYRLYASTNGVTWSEASNATYNGIEFGLVGWTVTALTQDTYFKPVAIIGLSPVEERALSAVLMARLSDVPSNITVTQPPSTSAPRLPRIVWNAVPGAVLYLVAVAPTSPPESDPLYAAALEGWRTSLLFGYRAGPGIIAGWLKPGILAQEDVLDASTQYNLMLLAVDATGWAVGMTQQNFTTGP